MAPSTASVCPSKVASPQPTWPFELVTLTNSHLMISLGQNPLSNPIESRRVPHLGGTLNHSIDAIKSSEAAGSEAVRWVRDGVDIGWNNKIPDLKAV